MMSTEKESRFRGKASCYILMEFCKDFVCVNFYDDSKIATVMLF